jgi:hypothetical protein
MIDKASNDDTLDEAEAKQEARKSIPEFLTILHFHSQQSVLFVVTTVHNSIIRKVSSGKRKKQAKWS